VALTFIAIVLLAAAWAALLLPDLRQRGGSSRRSNSIAKFSRQLSTIDRARPGQQPSARVVAFPQRGSAARRPAPRPSSALSPRSTAQARARRQNVLLGLLAIAVLTLVAGVFVSPMFFAVHVLADLVLGGFVYMLVEHRNSSFERRTKLELRGEYEHLQRRRASGS
jgi:cytochrome c-type biogenesis protein CcmH/NrfG